MDRCKLIIYSFIVTALWDVVLRIMAENFEKLPTYFKDHKFIEYLIPYFEKHTLLAAALIAGFIGATTQYIIHYIQPFPNKQSSLKYILQFLVVSFIISGLYGFIMKWSKLFPHLDETYYKNLGHLNGAYHDGVSGIIVQVTLLILYRLSNL
tara:strand:+ start:588 stop:1043 length:456 start_codon:yes stop_codon:yes gene_type:complete